jgi:hypothetical protein
MAMIPLTRIALRLAAPWDDAIPHVFAAVPMLG